MGFLTPSQGSVAIAGRPVRDALKAGLVAYVPQAEEVDWTFPVLVRDVVMMSRYGHMGFLRRPRPTDRAAVEQALERVGMSAFATRQIGELSGGQRKRVFLARALAQAAPVILLDEPFTGVDVKTEAAIIAILEELRSQGALMLVATHNLARCPTIAIRSCSSTRPCSPMGRRRRSSRRRISRRPSAGCCAMSGSAARTSMTTPTSAASRC